MTPEKQCTECGAELTPIEPGGLCRRCLLTLGLRSGSDRSCPSDLPDNSALNTELSSDPKSVLNHVGERIGRYKLLQKIGEGGFGVVYMAEQFEPVQRTVALKIIKAGMDTHEVIARFEAERQALALMNHPSIARVYDGGVTRTGRPYFVMELVHGIPITHFCDQENLPTTARLRLLIQVCKAVEHAHQKAIIHRDLKPTNVLVTLQDGEPLPKVIDFGVAKALGQKLTDKTLFTGFLCMVGTPAYMSPEQAELSGVAIDVRADIYALGVLLYELLTGVTPFETETFRKAAFDEVRRIIRETEPLKPSTRLQSLGEKLPEVARLRGTEPPKLIHLLRGDLDWIVMKCLEKERRRRYERPIELAQDVQRHLEFKPVLARPPSTGYRLKKWVRRRRTGLAIGSAASAAAAMGVALWTTVWHQTPPASDDRPSLAVLIKPADPADRFLSQEFSRGLTDLLSRLSLFEVIPHSETLKWANRVASPVELGNHLGANLVLLGEMNKQDEVFLLRTDLTEAENGSELWTRSWNEKLDAGVTVQIQIVRHLIAQLGVELTQKDRRLLERPWTKHPEAWRHYIRARQHADNITITGMHAALEEFRKAVDLDPAFARAYAGLASTHVSIAVWLEEPRRHFERASYWLGKALELDASFPEVKVAQGVLKYYYEWDWEGAAAILDEALLLDPSLLEADACYIHCMDVLGRSQQAIDTVRKAMALHPNSKMIQFELGCAYYYAGKFEDSIDAAKAALQQDPENPFHYWAMARALVQQKEYPRAVQLLETAQQKTDGNWYGILSELAYAYAIQGRTEEANRILVELLERVKNGEYVDPYTLAHIQLGLGNLEEVFKHLQRAFDSKSTWLPDLGIDPKFASVRNDPRYQEIYERLNLP